MCPDVAPVADTGNVVGAQWSQEAAQCAAGTVIVRYLRHAGLPILQWQRAAREGNGLKLKQLFAYTTTL